MGDLDAVVLSYVVTARKDVRQPLSVSYAQGWRCERRTAS
jgi:hypothetical protein